jgi:undecaprenyl-diphosphatase
LASRHSPARRPSDPHSAHEADGGRDADDAELVIDVPMEPPGAAYEHRSPDADDTMTGYVPAHARAAADTAAPPDGTRRALVVAGLVVAAVVAVVAVVLAARDAADRQEAGDHLGAADAVVLGLVEGVTEWLPISSTGHLTVTQDLLKIEGDAADSYAIAIQAGAILAVLLLFRERFEAMFRGIQGKDPEGRATFVAIVVACLPAVVIGLVAEDAIKDNLFGTGPVVAAWLVGGLVILAVARHRRRLDPEAGDPLTALTWQKALIIGCAQSLAMWPGVSRSLVTIVAATLLGLAIPAAVEFSFLLGFVTLGGATAYETLSSGDAMLEAYGLAMPLLGLVVAFVSAVAAMRWMVGYLQHRSLAIFGWYRIAIAIVVGLLLVAGAV